MIKLEAFQVAEQINLKRFKSDFAAKPHSTSSWEIFYVQENDKYIYVLNYGVVVFANYNHLEKSNFLRFLKPYLDKPVELEFNEDIEIEFDQNISKPVFTYNSAILPRIDENVIRITMLNIAQSSALDFYDNLTYQVISNTNTFTGQLEKFGKITVSKKDLLKFIGRTLNVKNSIVDNLYILDDPGIVWDDEYLEQVNKGLKDLFDIQIRFRDLDYKLKIVQDNLTIITDILQHRESRRLELIVIILILIEVMNVFWETLISAVK
jgi:uncharacterized Rmd1/YagE family protein